MTQKLKFSLLIPLALLFVISCTEYSKIVKSHDNEQKKEAALRYYEEGQDIKAITLLEDIIPYYKLTGEGEKLYFIYCMANYHLGDYYLSGFYFKRFVRQYPTSKNVEEALFLSALCSVKNSPEYSLDQTETYNALDEMQIFIDLYPNSSRIDTCNTIMDRMRAKLEGKQYEYAMLYYKTQNYKAAVVAFETTIEKYPESTHKEDILYYLVKSHFELATNSIPSKKLDRMKNTLKSYRRFAAEFPDSKKMSEMEQIRTKTEKAINVLEGNESAEN